MPLWKSLRKKKPKKLQLNQSNLWLLKECNRVLHLNLHQQDLRVSQQDHHQMLLVF
jgi:hypothetical protein